MSSWSEIAHYIAKGVILIVLSLLGGVGGSALMEIIWRPRRERERVIGLLGAEVAFNANLLLHHAEVRALGGPTVPSDLILSTMAWTAAGGLVREIPTDMLNELILLYNRFENLNRLVRRYDEIVRRRDSLTTFVPEHTRLDKEIRRTEDVFNTGVDSTIGQCKGISVELIRLGKIPKPRNDSKIDRKANVKKMMEDRDKRLGGR